MMQDQRDKSYLFGGNAPYVEELYESYLHDPASVEDHWRDYFDNVKQVPAVDGSSRTDIAHGPIVASFADRKSTRLNSSHSQQSRMPSSA